MKKPQKVVTVNHGDVFQNGKKWLTFHCPKCNKQIEKRPIQDQKCGGCFTPIDFY